MKSQDPPSEQLQVIVNLLTQKRLKQALFESSQMLEEFPNSVILFNIIGASNAGLKQYDVALENYKKALEIKPDYAEVYFNMGVTLKDKGDLNAAIDCYKQAIIIKPNYAAAYNNMGNILRDKGNPEAAIDCYKQAIIIKPNYAVAYNNMGSAQKDTGNQEAAIISYKKALKIRPDYDGAYKNIGSILKNVVFTRPISGLQEVISSIIDRKNIVKPQDICQATISLLRFEPVVKDLFKKYFLSELNQSLVGVVSNLSDTPLLLKLMSVCPISDLEFEAIFTDIRTALLISMIKIKNSPEVLQFQSALALQCFTNEYVYNQNDKETLALAELEAEVAEDIFKGGQPRSQSILCLASYKALHEYKWCDLLVLNSSIKEVVTRQIFEPKQESLLKAKILVLEEISNKVSSKVREQYEVSPYPRWINTGLSLKPETLSNKTKKLKLKLFNDSINDIDSPNILIAGCGTGQHSILVASKIKNAKILAIDLSLSSLAYAKRKTEELGIQNIDYMQADILDLGKLDRKFDIIQSSGVLHHMDDPMAGWRSLYDCLEVGGLMKIGLYSELARQHIVRMQSEIMQLGIGSSDIEMRSFRRDVISSNEDHHIRIRWSNNFYTLSELRDLLFHVQEHRFTIPQLKDSLSELDLKFCGFEADTIVRDFKLKNTGANDPYNLEKWHSYEQANPNAFIAMYQFWCQKVA